MRRPPLWKAALPLAAALLTALALLATAYADNYFNRGVAWDTSYPYIPHTEVNPLGANVFLDKEVEEDKVRRTLEAMRAGGFKFIRQNFLWRDIEPQRDRHWDDKHNQNSWAKYDRIVDLANEYGLEIIARLDRPPDWARQESMSAAHPDNTGPPDDYADYGDFVHEVVERYRGKVKYFQIWNEPNLHGEWNDQPIDPAGYVRLLQTAYTRAKAANPDCVILTAGLAPTDQLGPENLSDLIFVEEMYKNGAKDYFDIMSVMVYGLGYPPDDRRIDFQRANFSRPALTREIMVRYGDEDKPIWASEYAWISLPDDWTGRPSVWGDSVSEEQQARYLVRGYERAQEEWPWMGVMAVWAFRWVEPPDFTGEDPTPHFAIMRHDFTPRPAYEALKQLSSRPPVAYTGYASAGNEAIGYEGDWKEWAAGGRVFMVANRPGATATIRFKGTGLDLELGSVHSSSRLQVTVDGAPSPHLSQTNSAGSYLDLPPALAGWEATRHVLVRGLDDGEHTARITMESGEGVSVRGMIVIREHPFPWLFPAIYGVLTLVLIVSLAMLQPWAILLIESAPTAVARGVRSLASGTGPGGASESGRRVALRRSALFLPVMCLVLGVYYFSPSLAVSLGAAAIFAVLAVLRVDLAVALIPFAVPFLYHPKKVLGFELSLAEFLILVSLAAYLLQMVLAAAWAGDRHMPNLAELPGKWWKRLTGHPFAAPVALFLAIATISLLIPDAEHRRFSLREYRLVIVEPFIFYLLLVKTTDSEQHLFRAVNFLLGGGLAVSVLAIGQAVLGTQVIEVEGVSRVLGVFRHPNNLALYLDRIVLILAGLAIFLPSSRRRWAYALLIVPPAIALALTFSRGALATAGIGLLILALVSRNRRVILPVAAGLGLVAVAGIALLRVERFTSAIDPASWTRLSVWRSAIAMIRDHPIFGVGLDQFLYQYNPKYVLPEAWSERYTSHPHNILLDYWTRLGIMGVIAAGWLIIRFFQLSRDLLWRVNSGPARALAAGVFGSMVAFVLHGLVDNSYFLMDLALMFWLGLGAVEILHRSTVREKRRARSGRRERALESSG